MKRVTSRTAAAVAFAATLLIAGCSGSSEGSSAGDDGTTTSRAGLEMEMSDHDHGTDQVTELNGEVPPGEATFAKDQETLVQELDGQGHESLVHRTVRAPGTRAPIHIHGYGGTTCVLEGEMTLLIEGGEPALASAGTCYYMPPDVYMSGYNTGDVDAVMLDTFLVPEGEPEWVNLETE